jgi:hypothetical protein
MRAPPHRPRNNFLSFYYAFVQDSCPRGRSLSLFIILNLITHEKCKYTFAPAGIEDQDIQPAGACFPAGARKNNGIYFSASDLFFIFTVS